MPAPSARASNAERRRLTAATTLAYGQATGCAGRLRARSLSSCVCAVANRGAISDVSSLCAYIAARAAAQTLCVCADQRNCEGDVLNISRVLLINLVHRETRAKQKQSLLLAVSTRSVINQR